MIPSITCFANIPVTSRVIIKGFIKLYNVIPELFKTVCPTTSPASNPTLKQAPNPNGKSRESPTRANDSETNISAATKVVDKCFEK